MDSVLMSKSHKRGIASEIQTRLDTISIYNHLGWTSSNGAGQEQ